MQKAVAGLSQKPEMLLIDGNRFHAVKDIPHRCMVGGDAIFMHIAAASVLAKTHRDEFMIKIHNEFPVYEWGKNKGFPTVAHRNGIKMHGPSPYHRMTYKLLENQLSFNF
jgi:ribonuclease HII